MYNKKLAELLKKEDTMNIKRHLSSIVKSAVMGALFGYLFGYLGAFSRELPTSIEQFAHSLGIAGLTAGIISGTLPILIPNVLMPLIMKNETIQRIVSSSRLLRKIVKFFSNKEENFPS